MWELKLLYIISMYNLQVSTRVYSGTLVSIFDAPCPWVEVQKEFNNQQIFCFIIYETLVKN